MTSFLPDSYGVLLAPFVLEVIKFFSLSDRIIFSISEYYRLVLAGCFSKMWMSVLSEFGSRPALCVCRPGSMSHIFVLFVLYFFGNTYTFVLVLWMQKRFFKHLWSHNFFFLLSSRSHHCGELFFVLLHGGGSVAKLQRPAALSDHLEYGGWQAGGKAGMFHWSEVWCANSQSVHPLRPTSQIRALEALTFSPLG